ncbi:hypothetical protein [Vibrio mimicus]|uniref:hypothetical protein n=1 Tax=Vibrio mimicus TaxID=674 RepID=UPI002FEE9328
MLHNARLRGWQRTLLNSITTAETTAAQWDWKRHALAVPLEAFVSFVAHCLTMTFLTHLFEKHFTQMHQTNTRPTPKAVKLAAKTQNDQG